MTCLTSEMEKLGDHSRRKSMGFDIRQAGFESELAYSLSDLGQVSVLRSVEEEITSISYV